MSHFKAADNRPPPGPDWSSIPVVKLPTVPAPSKVDRERWVNSEHQKLREHTAPVATWCISVVGLAGAPAGPVSNIALAAVIYGTRTPPGITLDKAERLIDRLQVAANAVEAERAALRLPPPLFRPMSPADVAGLIAASGHGGALFSAAACLSDLEDIAFRFAEMSPGAAMFKLEAAELEKELETRLYFLSGSDVNRCRQLIRRLKSLRASIQF
jgi:hypothetical protein